MIIKKIELSNFQCISDFNADFEGNIYFVTGDNELGKSTLLKAIYILLTGDRDEVLKNGENKGYAKMVVGDDGEEFEVELRFTKNNPRGTISIKQKSTGMESSNVSAIQRMFGYTDFDAVEFSRWSETAEGRRKQIEVVKSLLPEKVRSRIAEIDKAVINVKESRKDLNSELKTYTTICNQAEKLISPGDVKKYADSIDVTEIVERHSKNIQLIEKAKNVISMRKQREEQLNKLPSRLNDLEEIYEDMKNVRIQKIKDSKLAMEKAIEEAKMKHEREVKELDAKFEKNKSLYESEIKKLDDIKIDLETRIDNANKWLSEYEKINPENSNTSEELKQAEEHNRIHKLVVDYLNKKENKDSVERKVNEQERELSELLNERDNLINNSKLPINGLTFTEDGLELNGVPFVAGKVSDSQIMEVATQLIIASNPRVKVFRIARGESLGEKRLQAILETAKNNGFQGFIETVVRGQEELIIEEYTEVE